MDNIYYKTSKGKVYLPFDFRIDLMEYLILIEIQNDLDKYYKTFEIQQAVDEKGNKKILVIAYRIDGGSDIYHQQGYPISNNNGVLNNVELFLRLMEGSKFLINDDELIIYVKFKDKYDRDIELKVSEIKRKKKKPFSILAPIGGGAEKPTSLPIYLLYEMSFIKRKYSDIDIKIGNRRHKPDTFPLPIEWTKNYFSRYSADAFLVDWNNYTGPLIPIKVNNNKIKKQGVKYEFVNNQGNYEIKRLSVSNKKNTLCLNFSPAFPDISSLRKDANIKGKFFISSKKSAGKIKGVYYIKRIENNIHIYINPSGGWKPKENKITLKLLYIMGPIFKKWPSTYILKAIVELKHDAIIKSSWEKEEGWKEKVNKGLFKLLDD